MTISYSGSPCIAGDSNLVTQINQFVNGLDGKFSIERDNEQVLGCEVILVDNSICHWEIYILISGIVNLVHQEYTDNGLKDIAAFPVTSITQIEKVIK